jgi:hypothetical protein
MRQRDRGHRSRDDRCLAGPVTGSLVAELAARETSALDLYLLRPDRFT